MDYRMAIQVKAPFDRAVAWVTEALREQGFGVLTTIDVQATLHAKLGVEMEQYIILGACNPTLAHRALEADRGVGLLLPCNVVIRADSHRADSQHGEVERTVVEAVNPNALIGVAETSEFEPIAHEASRRLASALATVAAVGR